MIRLIIYGMALCFLVGMAGCATTIQRTTEKAKDVGVEIKAMADYAWQSRNCRAGIFQVYLDSTSLDKVSADSAKKVIEMSDGKDNEDFKKCYNLGHSAIAEMGMAGDQLKKLLPITSKVLEVLP